MCDRKPEAGDADEYGCVIVWHLLNGAMTVGWRNAANNRYHSHWMRIPDAPMDAEEKKKAIEAVILGSRFRH